MASDGYCRGYVSFAHFLLFFFCVFFFDQDSGRVHTDSYQNIHSNLQHNKIGHDRKRAIKFIERLKLNGRGVRSKLCFDVLITWLLSVVLSN